MFAPTVLAACSPPSLSDNEITETIFFLPLAGRLLGDALWLGMHSMHSWPIIFTVSKRLKHVRLFKSNQGLTRLFRCIFHCVKNKKPGGKGLRVDECENPDSSDWCLKWSAHLRQVKGNQSEARVEWMNFGTMYSSWTLNFPMNIDQILLPLCFICSKWSLERVRG